MRILYWIRSAWNPASERGVTAIEYALIAALIALAIIAAVTLVGTRLNTLFNSVAVRIHT